MENFDIIGKKAFSVSLEKNPIISIDVLPGHFTTGNAHSNNYLDVSGMKSNVKVARDVAQELARPYVSTTMIDTIVCMEKTEVIGAYLAEDLMQGGMAVVNGETEIHVVTPTTNTNGHLVFQDNMINWITNKQILLLVATISSGKTVKTAMDCLNYYGGILAGISTLFLSSHETIGQEIHALFMADDIPGYKLFEPGKCEMCRLGHRLEAMVSSGGYTKLN